MLKKGDKVIIHTHRNAKIYKDKIFTVMTDEKEVDGDRVVFLKELGENGKLFWVEYCSKVG